MHILDPNREVGPNFVADAVEINDALWRPIFEPLKDVAQFRQFEVSSILHTIRWDNDADLAPEFLHQKLLEQSGRG